MLTIWGKGRRGSLVENPPPPPEVRGGGEHFFLLPNNHNFLQNFGF